MVPLAHIREQRRLSLGSCGRPRMTAELKDLGLAVGECRVGRLMKGEALIRHWSEDNAERDSRGDTNGH
ncbi:MAG: transposase [Rhodobacteraceae bacterium]|nr:transposase [Paracoccaceae bacterium]